MNLNDVFVSPGESVTYGGNAIICGFVTSAQTGIRLTVPVGKWLTNVTNVNVTQITGYIRNEGGYALAKSSTNSNRNYLSYVKSATIDHRANAVYIQIEKGSGKFYLTNNQPLTYVPDSLTLKFE